MDQSQSTPASAVIPRATYRLQLHREFDFDAAVRVLPYLHRLGVSHVYCSPITRARTGSLHGYDVIDHREISPELGGRAGFERLSLAARTLGMGLLLDMVPNHMGVLGGDNPWWTDVLESGRASPFANYFDIDWDPPNSQLRDKVLLPVLGLSYGETLDNGQLQIEVDDRLGVICVVAYGEHRFPLDPNTWPAVLRPAAAESADDRSRDALDGLSKQAASMPARSDLHQVGERAVAVKTLKERLAAVLQSDPQAAAAMASTVRRLNDAAGRDELHALLETQAYRLAHWRVAADEINYRRFFDINELAALRIEDEQVFEATQGPTLDLTAAGLADGLRIDHPDGLRDPAQYFERLQEGHARRIGIPPLGEGRGPRQSPPLYVLIEKIAASHEDVPHEWAVHGTTGYRFANVVNGLFVDRRQAARFERIWRSFSGRHETFDEIVHEARSEAATNALGSELTVLAHMLGRIAAQSRRWRDQGYNTLRNAIAEVAACMPVYRTYVVDKPAAQDDRFIDWAIAHARQRSQIADLTVFDFLRACMRAEDSVGSNPTTSAEQVRRFAWRFQQFCAPVAAKGVEDTAFYRYHRLISLNDVGGDPAAFGVTITAFHGASADRATRWPHTMLATSTHDNKRSEDVRNRIDVLCEYAAAWRLSLRKWHTMTRSFRQQIGGREAPSAADEMLLYQTLLGTLPVGDDLNDETLQTYRERIEAYALKAAREAKRETSWVRPNEAYEAALANFVRSVLGRLAKNPVLADLRARADELARFGAYNSVTMALLKFTSPGVPDVYQGNEIIDLSLVDPDNRRPVDYELRERMLDGLASLVDDPQCAQKLRELALTPTDGRLKLWTTWRLLELRRRNPTLFREGGYLPLRVRGEERDHVIAFARRTKTSIVIVIAARLMATLARQSGVAGVGEACWRDTIVDASALLPQGASHLKAVNVLTGQQVSFDAGEIRMADAFSDIPVAAFEVEVP